MIGASFLRELILMEIEKDSAAQFKESLPRSDTCEWQGMNTASSNMASLASISFLASHVPDSKLSNREKIYENNMSLCWYATF